MHIPNLEALQAQEAPITLFWFRRDLRLADNHALYQALKGSENILPFFIFDTNILGKLTDPRDRRVHFIHEQIQTLQHQLATYHSSLWVCYGKPAEIYQLCADTCPIRAVYANHDYEPYAQERDDAIRSLLAAHSIPFYTYKDQVIFEKDELTKDDGTPYTVYTPYMKKWKAMFRPDMIVPFDTHSYAKRLMQLDPLPMIALGDMGFQPSQGDFPPKDINRARILQYDKTRNIPGIAGTSKLSVHLRFGTMSIREVTRVAQETNEVWLNELIWRNFYMMILWHFPYVTHRSFKPAYDAIDWRNDEAHFQAWCAGRTGYPIVDAGMRELNQTGYMHNRLRMITASFLTKDLLIDWRWGEAYFARQLLDYELASNNGGWQWAAGSGCDAAPYFRIFNPTAQMHKFDPDQVYTKRWNPHFQDTDYPLPIVDHATTRVRTLAAYKKALESEAWYQSKTN